MLMLLLAACGSQPVRHAAAHPALRSPPIVFVDVPPADPARANDVLIRAIGLVGTPYKWGGNTPDSGFDCSGLVDFVFRDMGRLQLPRTAHDLAAMPVPAVRDNRLAPGDLLLFGENRVTHVGIYVGQGRFVHAPNSGGTVRLDEINGWYWREHYLGARRLLR
jgi:cell wall-associated NlpC family hydrolase